jgi:hypothetical protein
MKVAVGSRPYDGPWGGGNRFAAALCEALRGAGHNVVHELEDPDIDIILLTDPRIRAPNVCFGAGAILRYLAWKNPNAIVVHRINECDERKGEPFITAKLVRANYVADATVFVGEWLTKLPVWRDNLRSLWFVVRNGADTSLFHGRGFQPWRGEGPLRLVTHHWGYHPMKGFDVYALLDDLLARTAWHGRLSFTYIGNIPKDFAFAHARYVPPLDGTTLAEELRSHHAYVTGSQNEPGGHHQNEGALCGLPLLYRNSGCMPEYCAGFGVPFEGPRDLEPALERLIAAYPRLVDAMPRYPWTAERMTREWIALFDELIAQRPAIIARRRLWRDPLAVLASQLAL